MATDPTPRPPAPLRRRRPLSPTDGPRPPRKAARTTTAPPEGPPSVWTEAKVQAVLQSAKSMLANLANKHGVPLAEVVSLVKDYLNDPDD